MATGPGTDSDRDTDFELSAAPGSRQAPGLAATVVVYTVARLGLVAVIAALLALVGVPLLLAILLALVVALPLSLVVFRGLRARLDLALAESGRRRSAQRDALRARLRGDDPADDRAGASADRPTLDPADGHVHGPADGRAHEPADDPAHRPLQDPAGSAPSGSGPDAPASDGQAEGETDRGPR
ncbi:DUF4229 domain-containing protein [Pseudonocardia sp. RS010]|uniref:DUF4229 domain-containing protein n=1 Tax=Pseudonocardia sp. RS010 TaxID=3385979 RepID=UPI0039A12651